MTNTIETFIYFFLLYKEKQEDKVIPFCAQEIIQ